MVPAAAFEQPSRKMALARVPLTPFLMGLPVGPVADGESRMPDLKAAMGLLASAQRLTVDAFGQPGPGLTFFRGRRKLKKAIDSVPACRYILAQPIIFGRHSLLC
jgi:hypothetical protein